MHECRPFLKYLYFHILPTDDSKAVLNPYDSNCDGQKWTIKEGRIQKKSDPKKVLDIVENKCDDGAGLCVSDFKSTNSQSWCLESA